MEKKYQCQCCGQVKNIDDFYEDNRRALGVKTDACKQCKHEKYLLVKEKKIKYQLEWNTLNYSKVKEYITRYNHKKSNFVTV